MRANELRRAFTSFFADRDHLVVESASLIPHDPTLLFTVAGMVPFKPYFLGEETPPAPRATSVQKCVRAGGKHNDLDEIGRTSRHLTFFEMLGNFSFGDYFKADAIPMAWEFVTDVLGLDPERLWVTVHLTDDEAEAIWRDEVGVAPQRIQRLDEDNYWRMADTGPCGPCSEIFWDKGPDFGPDGGPANPNADERYVEIWNLVFMQFDQRPDGQQHPLPKPSIDTGAGLERMLSVVQGVDSVWDTDEFQRLLTVATDVIGVGYGADDRTDISLRILADHARSTTFLVNDGVFPSNEERGYVLRRIIRRAVRHAYLLGLTSGAAMPAMVDAVVDVMGADYPDLVANHDVIHKVIAHEEDAFRRTLETGTTLLDSALAELKPGAMLAGDVAFSLHDTYGFPLELTEEIATERGVTVDRAGFDTAMDQQRRRAKEDHRRKLGTGADTGVYQEVLDQFGPTEFVGRSLDEASARILFVDDSGIVLDRTPFYAESGGQVGDTGTISTPTGTATISDTVYAIAGLQLHQVGALDGHIEPGQVATASIDSERRAAIRRNHTGTHLLHWALQEVLGDHVKQQGSWVGPDRLRFDFSHFEALTPDEIARIEDLANREVLANSPVRHFETTMDEARALGAKAFFGDKYGDIVRVLEAGPHSTELCGGTHVQALGDIGPLKIVAEGSIGSNLRRIEAVCGQRPIELLRAEEARVSHAAELLGVPSDDLVEGAERRMAEIKRLNAELASLRQQAAAGQAIDLVQRAIDGVVVARVDGVDRDGLRDLAAAVRDADGVRAAVLGAALDSGGVALVAAVSPDTGLNAAELIADAARRVKGGGGKDPLFAVAGGKDPGGLDDALGLARAAAGID